MPKKPKNKKSKALKKQPGPVKAKPQKVILTQVVVQVHAAKVINGKLGLSAPFGRCRTIAPSELGELKNHLENLLKEIKAENNLQFVELGDTGES